MTLLKADSSPAQRDRAVVIPANPGRLIVVLAALAGFALTLAVYFPGVMTFDSKYIYADVLSGFRGDWQSPVMTELWRLVDPLAPGPASMFVTMAALYWIAFGVLGLALARTSFVAAILMLGLAASPPAFLLVGIIWRDVLFAALWLLAAGLVFAGRQSRALVLIQVLALALISVGVLLRLNAIFAAPVLVAYILWPNGFYWKRTALLLVPLAAAFFVLTQLVYYGVLDAKRQHALHSILVLDLGGVSAVTGENQFPGSWSADDSARIVGVCEPKEWDNYWTRDPCKFVMAQLEVRDGLFGTSALSRAWFESVTEHPLAYVQHRLAFFWHFLSGDNLTMWVIDVEDQSKIALADKPAFRFVKALNDALKPTPLMRPGVWFLACIAVCVVAWPRRATPASTLALSVAGSAVVYVLTYLAVGVASDFRFAYWAVIAAIAGGATLYASRQPAA